MIRLLTKAFTLGGLFRSGWFLFALLGTLGGIAGGSYYMGNKHANAACSNQKLESENAAISRTATANLKIGNIKVEAERQRSATREVYHEITETFGDGSYIQELLLANNCELDPERLRLINRAILRTSGSD